MIPNQENVYRIIPMPAKGTISKGTYRLLAETVIAVDDNLTKSGNFLRQIFAPATGFKLPVIDLSTADSDANAIVLQIDASLQSLGKEGYKIKVVPNRITLSSADPNGIFLGLSTLRQLFPAIIEDPNPSPATDPEQWKCACGEIEDYPRFQWRGVMMDVCRHFFDVNVIKRMMDAMVLMKLNTFHWHLTEDQGWRIEIKKYPKLTEIGSKRKGTQTKGGKNKEHDSIPHGGFFTQEEVKEVLAYAAERYITVVPEIEMPGHSLAALAAYPEFGCTGGPYEVGTYWGVIRDVYCAGKEKVVTFLKDVLDEVLELFPSEIIHIGGDECPKDRWKVCPDCQAKIKAEGLADAEALQTYFVNDISQYLADKGRRLMGWNEILDKNLAPNAIGHFWMGSVDPIVSHLESGRNFVMSPNPFMYLDKSYYSLPLEKIYGYEPIPKNLASEHHKNILGLESPLWAERIPTEERLHHQAFPRLIALAENGWTPSERKNYGTFLQRLGGIFPRLEALGVKFASIEEADPGFIRKLKRKFNKY